MHFGKVLLFDIYLLSIVALISFPENGLSARRKIITMDYLWKILNEDVLLVKIDSLIAKQFVPPDFEVYTDASSKAHLLLVNQNNREFRHNSRNLGPVDEVLHWVRIIKPGENRFIPGTEITLRTVPWYVLFAGSSKTKSLNVWKSAGTAAFPITGVSLNRDTDIKSGEAVLSENKRYRWNYKIKSSRKKLVGVTHDLYYTAADGKNKLHKINAAAEVSGWGSKAELTITGGDENTRYLPAGRYEADVHTFKNVWATITLGMKST